MSTFATLSLKKDLLSNLESLKFEVMTPIQSQALPLMLLGHDVIGQAQTGSGKTAAFGLLLLNSLVVEKYAVQSLVLCPTRELAEQVAVAIRQLARQMPNVKVLNLSGGMPMKAQLDSLRHGAHIIVGTPGRVLKHLTKTTLSLKHLKTLVLDEADRMLDMGFYDAMRNILALCPTSRQTLLFSATFPPAIKSLSAKFLNHPQHIVIKNEKENEKEHAKSAAKDITQIFYHLDSKQQKFNCLPNLLYHYQPEAAIIFCNTKDKTNEIADMLNQAGFSAKALNGDMAQLERDLAVIQFKNKSYRILVATDVAARGLDIAELPMVINFELAFEKDVHTHRIGRTGRAGHKGLAISLTTSTDKSRIEAIEVAHNQALDWGLASDIDQAFQKGQAKTKIKHPEMKTISLNAGKKDKLRPGDILGALTKDAGFSADLIGKIDIMATMSFVAVAFKIATSVVEYFQQGKLKGRKVNVRKIT